MKRRDMIEEALLEEMAAGKGGGLLHSGPVCLAPPFAPFSYRSVRKGPRKRSAPRPAVRVLGRRALRLVFDPAGVTAERKVAWVESLATARMPVCLEVLIGEAVRYQLASSHLDAGLLQQSLPGSFPGAYIEPVQNENPSFPHRAEWGLRASHFFPLAIRHRVDPAEVLLAGGGGGLLIQFLFVPLPEGWRENLRIASRDEYDVKKSAFTDLPDLPRWAGEKASQPLFAVSVRAAGPSENDLRRVDAYLGRFASTENGFVRLPGTLPKDALSAGVAFRPGMVLSIGELGGILPLPTAAVSARLEPVRKTALAPDAVDPAILHLGTNHHRGMRRKVGLSEEQLTRHVAVFGRTGSGKSNLLSLGGQIPGGLCLIDFHGDLAEAYLKLLPEGRVQEALYFNAADEDFPPAFNPLKGGPRRDDVLVSDLLVAFRRYFGREFWGPRMEMILRNALLALMGYPEELTLRDLQAFFLSNARRREILQGVRDPAVRQFWEEYFPGLARGAIHPIVNKLDRLLGTHLLRQILGRPDRVDVDGILREGKILIVNLARGVIGQAEAELLAYLLVARLHAALLARAGVPPAQRRLFTLVCDEFQCLADVEGSAQVFASLFSEARKFRGAVIVAAQYVRALSREVQAALFGNVGTLVCFNVGVEDAQALARELGRFEPQDLLDLGKGEAVVRMGRAGQAFNLKVPLVVPPSNGPREGILARSRDHFGRPVVGAPGEPATADTSEPLEIEETAQPPACPDLGPEGERFLRLLMERPFLTVREAYGALGLTPRAGNDLKERLLRRGWLLEMEVPAGRRGRPPKALLPSATGLEAIGADIPDRGKGGPLHCFLQDHVAKVAVSKGYDVAVEASLGRERQSTDVVLEREGRRTAVELSVTTGAEHEMENLFKCVEDGFDRVWIGCLDGSQVAQIRQKLENSESKFSEDRVFIGLIPEILRLL